MPKIPSRPEDMGELSWFGYHLSKDSKARRHDLGAAIAAHGALHTWHEIHALRIRMRGNRLHKGYYARALADERWISRTHLKGGR